MLIGVKNYSKSVYQAGYEEKEGKKDSIFFKIPTLIWAFLDR